MSVRRITSRRLGLLPLSLPRLGLLPLSLLLLGAALTAGCGGSGGGSTSSGQTVNLQVATGTVPVNGLVVHSGVLQLTFDGQVIGQTTDDALPPGPNTAYQYQTFSVPNVSSGKHILLVKCISSSHPQLGGTSFLPLYPANVTADVGSSGINLGQTITVNLIVS